MVGHGSFGAVFQAKVVETNEVVAIKKVLQDRRFKNRELQIMRQLSKQPHPYIVILKHYFVSKGSKADEVLIITCCCHVLLGLLLMPNSNKYHCLHAKY